jgi:hypothetical protein
MTIGVVLGHLKRHTNLIFVSYKLVFGLVLPGSRSG